MCQILKGFNAYFEFSKIQNIYSKFAQANVNIEFIGQLYLELYPPEISKYWAVFLSYFCSQRQFCSDNFHKWLFLFKFSLISKDIYQG